MPNNVVFSGHGLGLGLNLGNLPKADYHEEFLAKKDEFSESWR
jgi:hypothetical protein